MSWDDSKELNRKSTRGIFVLHLARLFGLKDEQLTWCIHGSVPRLGDFRGQDNPKESREQHEELWEVGGGGDGMSEGVPKDGSEIRLLTKTMSESD